MTLENKVKDLLNVSPTYFQAGAKRIADALGISNPSYYQLAKIKAVKKDYSKIEIKEITSIPSDFERQFIEVAKKLGYAKIEDSPASKSKITREYNPFDIKDSTPNHLAPSFSHQKGMHILLGCSHVPFHNVPMHNGIINLLRDYDKKIKGFHLLGDFLDLNALSSHDKGKFTAVPGLTLDHEYDAGNSLLDEFDSVLHEDVWKTYLYGNHEDRHNRWMSSTDNAKTPLMSPLNKLSLEGRGYQTKTNWSRDFFTIGLNLQILHGIYFSIHCAKAHLDKLKISCAFPHTHRIQNYNEGSLGAYNIGTGADFNSPAFNYASRPMKAQWKNGFAIANIDEDGRHYMEQVHVDDKGHFYYGGKKY